MTSWSPFESWNSFIYELELIGANIIYTIKLLESFFLTTGIIIIVILFFIWKFKSQKAVREKLVYLLITMIIYVGGYCLIVPEWRYLWIIFILLMISSFYMVDYIYKNKYISNYARNILLILLILSFVMEPIYEISEFSSTDNNVYNLSNTLKNDYSIKGNLASNNEWTPVIAGEKWGTMLYLSYFLNCKYYGLTKKNSNLTDLENELKTNNIDYYFVWDNNNTLALSDYNEITEGKIKSLKIYSRVY
jgi:hypothetical protein